MADTEFNFESLKARQRQLDSQQYEHLCVRTHRCISWIGRAESEVANDDYSAAFIFYWIAFNSIYSAERLYGVRSPEKDVFTDFFRLIIDLDRDRYVYNAIWVQFSKSIRTLLRNKYVFQPFWEHVNDPEFDWEKPFESSNHQVLQAFEQQDTVKVLCRLFDRLYVLRNQLMHGGATWNSTVNRHQVRDGVEILNFLVPIFVIIMMEHPGIPWSKPFYPNG